MKILFFVSGNVKSNFSYRAVALAKELNKLGYQATIIAPRADKYNDFVPEIVNTIDGVAVVQPFQFSTRRMELNLLPYIFGAIALALREETDIIYIYKPTPITIVGLFTKIFRGRTVILDMDDLGSEVMKIEGYPWLERTLVAWCEHLAARYADRIVVASRYLYKYYRKKFPKKPIHIMPNGVESDWFTAPITPKHETASEIKSRIVFMGAMNRMNILGPLFKTLPNICLQHPDVQVLMIGDGRYAPYFKKMCSTLGIDKNVNFTGWLPLSEMRERLCAGDIGYSYMPNDPTTQAASIMKVPQYMARGVVPIVSDVGDLPATVDFGNAGYIAKADNEDGLQSVLLKALEDKERAKKSAQARAFSKEHLSWNRLAQSFEQWNAHYG